MDADGSTTESEYYDDASDDEASARVKSEPLEWQLPALATAAERTPAELSREDDKRLVLQRPPQPSSEEPRIKQEPATDSLSWLGDHDDVEIKAEVLEFLRESAVAPHSEPTANVADRSPDPTASCGNCGIGLFPLPASTNNPGYCNCGTRMVPTSWIVHAGVLCRCCLQSPHAVDTSSARVDKRWFTQVERFLASHTVKRKRNAGQAGRIAI